MNYDVLEKLKDYVSTVEAYVLSMYSDGVETLLDDLRHLDYETNKLKSWIEELEAIRSNNNMIYDLIVCWGNGLKDTFTFTSEEAAKNAEKGFKKAFEDQVICTCINKRLISF